MNSSNNLPLSIAFLEDMIDITDEILVYSSQENIDQVEHLLKERESIINHAIRYRESLILDLKKNKEQSEPLVLRLREKEKTLNNSLQIWSTKSFQSLKETHERKSTTHYIQQG